MYEQVFNLTSRPFTSMHYVKHYFPAKDIEGTLQMCKMVIDRATGPVVVVGDHGTGKTLLLAMLEGAFKSKYLLVNISAAAIRNREDLLQNILYQLQVYSRGMSENDMRMELIENLRNDKSNGIVLMVDDAHKLSTESIEELQIYLDFIREGQPHVRLVLAGSRGLEDRLADSRLVAFNQRVAGRGFLGCLSRDETEAYVRAHLERANGNPDALFDPEAYRAIQEVTDGRPRFINQVCDHAMIFSATRGIVPITDSLIREAWFDIQRLPGAVSPAGSGAAASETPVSTQTIESGESDGWTVLEFGQLNDAAIAAPISEPVASETPPPLATEPSVQEAVASQVQTPAEPPQVPAAPATIQGPSFSIGQDGQVQSTDPSAVPIAEANQQQPVQSGTPEMAMPTAVGGAAILASAMQGFGAEQTQPAVEAPAPVESIQQQPPQVQAPAAQPPAYVQPEPTAVVEQPAPVTEDPFGSHQYDNEEVLADAYSPFVAQQNQRSLDLTSDQLQDLTPTDQQGVQSSVAAEMMPQVEEESFPTFETAIQPPEPVREPVKPTVEPRDMLETREETAPLGPNSLSEEFLLNRGAVMPGQEPTGAGDPAPSVSVEPVVYAETNVQPGYVPLDPDASPVAPVSDQTIPAAPQPAGSISVSVEPSVSPSQVVPEVPMQPPAPESFFEPASEQIAAPNVSVPDIPFPTNVPVGVDAQDMAGTIYHEQSTDPNDSDIRRQAEEIIRSLSVGDEAASAVPEPFPVSHETIQPEPTIEEETNAIEATIQRSIEAGQTAEPVAEAAVPPPVVMPDINAIQQALQAAQDSNGYQQAAAVPPTQPVPQQPPVAQQQPTAPQQVSPQDWPVPPQVPPQQPQQVQQVVPQQVVPQQPVAPPQQVAPSQPAPQPPMPAIPHQPQSIPVQMANDPVAPEQQILQQVREQSAMIAESALEAQGQGEAQDDRDILAINAAQAAAQAAAPTTEESLPTWTQQEPSTGEAARVDYQKLFDQLRNVPGQQQ